MIKFGKVINREVIERTELSEKLPVFDKVKRGTEIFIIKNRKRISVYDDYTMYPEGDAKKWRLKLYNSRTGGCYEKISINNGIYPTREKALSEIDRFLYRGEDLVFYLTPIEFYYNKKELLWPAALREKEKGFATYEEQQEEAKKRLFCITNRMRTKDIDLKKDVMRSKGYYDKEERLDMLEEFCESRKDDLPYYSSPYFDDIDYVGKDKSLWEWERRYIR